MRQCYCKTRWSTNPAMIYSMAPKHVLDLLLKGPQLVSIVTIHTKTVSKPSILTQRDELQRRVDKWGPENSQALFAACSNGVCKYLFEINEKPRTECVQCLGASLIGSISNTWYHGHWKGWRGKTEEQRSSHSPKRNLPRTESEVRCMICPCNTQCTQTHDRNMS